MRLVPVALLALLALAASPARAQSTATNPPTTRPGAAPSTRPAAGVPPGPGTPTTAGGALRPDVRPTPDTGRPASEKIDAARQGMQTGPAAAPPVAPGPPADVLGSGFVPGTTLSSASFRSLQAQTRCEPSEVTVRDVRYQRCGSLWFTTVTDGAETRFVVAPPPPGFER